ncbi:hypothetical protein V8E54_007974 [Elaphomyces granulatus]
MTIASSLHVAFGRFNFSFDSIEGEEDVYLIRFYGNFKKARGINDLKTFRDQQFTHRNNKTLKRLLPSMNKASSPTKETLWF